MPRRRVPEKKTVLPDPRFNSTVVSKFIKRMMLDGKKAVASGVMYDAMDLVEQKSDTKPLEVFLKALENVKPVVEVKSRRVGGSTYQVPVEIRDTRREALAMRWIRSIAQVQRSKRKKIPTEWQRPIRLLPIIDGNYRYCVDTAGVLVVSCRPIGFPCREKLITLTF